MMDFNSTACSLASSTSSSTTTGSGEVKKKRRTSKSHVSTACVNCKRAHLACDLERPCKRCVSVGKTDTCVDIQHKKRGRPKLRDRRILCSPTRHSVVEHQGTPLSIAVAPAITPDLMDSSFSMTQLSENHHSENITTVDQQVMTIFLSMDLRCARVSDESLNFLGLYPQELVHRSIYDLIASDSEAVMTRIQQCFDKSIQRQGVYEPATSEKFATAMPCTLLSIANGSQTLKDTLAFKCLDGKSQLFDGRFYLGGGLGADLFVPTSIRHLYMVCLLTRHRDNSQSYGHTQLQHSPCASPPNPGNSSPSLSSCSSTITTSSSSVLTHHSFGLHSPNSHLLDSLQATSAYRTNLDLFPDQRALSISHSTPSISIESDVPEPSPEQDAQSVPEHTWSPNRFSDIAVSRHFPSLSRSITLPHDGPVSTDDSLISRSLSSDTSRVSHPNAAAYVPITSQAEQSIVARMQSQNTSSVAPSRSPSQILDSLSLINSLKLFTPIGQQLHTSSSIIIPATGDTI